MQIVSAASAFPKNYYTQAEILAGLEQYWGERLENPQTLRRLYKNIGVDGRYLALPAQSYFDMKTWGQYNNAWIDVAVNLGEESLTTALSRAGLVPRDINALFFVSVTGICSPSVDALLVNRMGLSPNIKRVPIFGLGCVAGAAGIARASDYVRAFPDHVAAVLSVELCSLTLQREDISVANLISGGLFGDGSAVALVAGDARTTKGPKILATRSVFYPDTQEMMGWDVSEKGFRIVLSPEVPNLIKKQLGGDVDAFLADHHRSRSDIKSWVLHTGGPKILEATATALGLSNGQLDASWACLRKTGNLSSASVLCVLEEVMQNRRPAPGTPGLLAAMGPGFCSELVLLEW
jgi:alkylresorcinol/alkylpyrone synthase